MVGPALQSRHRSLDGNGLTQIRLGAADIAWRRSRRGCRRRAEEIYDLSKGAFADVGPMVEWRERNTGTLLGDGRVLFAGGFHVPDLPGANPAYLASAEIYDPATNKFAPTGSMKTPRENAQAVRLTDGRVLIVGGDQGDAGDEVLLSSAEIFDPAAGKFTPTGRMHDARSHFSATLLADGRVLVAGGIGIAALGAWDTAEVYDPATGR